MMSFSSRPPFSAEGDAGYVLALRFDDANCNVLVVVKRNWIAEYGAEAALISQTLDHTD